MLQPNNNQGRMVLASCRPFVRGGILPPEWLYPTPPGRPLPLPSFLKLPWSLKPQRLTNRTKSKQCLQHAAQKSTPRGSGVPFLRVRCSTGLQFWGFNYDLTPQCQEEGWQQHPVTMLKRQSPGKTLPGPSAGSVPASGLQTCHFTLPLPQAQQEGRREELNPEDTGLRCRVWTLADESYAEWWRVTTILCGRN